jgi:hypothetical protein
MQARVVAGDIPRSCMRFCACFVISTSIKASFDQPNGKSISSTIPLGEIGSPLFEQKKHGMKKKEKQRHEAAVSLATTSNVI